MLVAHTTGEIDCREGLLVAVEKCKYESIEEGIDVGVDVYIDVSVFPVSLI